MKKSVLSFVRMLARPDTCYWVNKGSVQKLLQLLDDDDYMQKVIEEGAPMYVIIFVDQDEDDLVVQMVANFTADDIISAVESIDSLRANDMMDIALRDPRLYFDVLAKIVIKKQRDFSIGFEIE